MFIFCTESVPHSFTTEFYLSELEAGVEKFKPNLLFITHGKL